MRCNSQTHNASIHAGIKLHFPIDEIDYMSGAKVMAGYRKILVAIDFSSAAEHVVARAKEMASVSQAEMKLVTVVEFIPPIQPAGDILMGVSVDFDERHLVDLAKARYEQFSEQHDLEEYEFRVLQGDVRRSITDYAEELGSDLIVIGSHGRHGWGLLLGSTANAVLHHAKCDVLAVRVEE